MTTPLDQDPMTDHEFVYCGSCTLQGGQPGALFRQVIQGRIGEDLAVTRKNVKATIGGVYAIPATAGVSRVRLSEQRYLRTWGNDADVLAWRVESDKILAKEREARLRKSSETEARDAALKALDPLRRLHKKTDSLGQRLIEAMALEYLRR